MINKIRSIRNLIGIAIIFCCCQSPKHKSDKQIVFSKFPKEASITFNKLIEYPSGVISRMFLRDTSLIVYNWRGTGGYFFYEYGISSKKNIGKYMPRGRGNGKTLGSLSAGIYKNNLWMYDNILNKIILADLKNNLLDTVVYREYPFAHKYYNIQLVNYANVVANGNYKMPNKLQEINLKSTKITADFGVLHDSPDSAPYYAWKRANEGLLSLKTSNDKVAIAHLWSDKIEIFNLKTKRGLMIKGPEDFKAEFAIFKSNDGEDLIARNEKSRNAFRSIMTTDKYIYALFSGEIMGDPSANYGKTIFVYDWMGNPVKKINLDKYVSSFVVSNDDDLLYAYDVISNYIVVANL